MTGLPGRWISRLKGYLSPATIRAHIADVTDGILAIAGFSEGLAAAGATTEVYRLLFISALAGAFSTAAVSITGTAADREAEQRLVAEEMRLLELSPQEEMAELAAHFEAKGVSPRTARRVAEELSSADALSAQLETEYGIRELTTAGQPILFAVASGVSFLLGAGVPLILARLWPGPWLDEYTLVAVVVSLSVTALVLARLGGTKIWATLARSVFIGVASLGASHLAASIIVR
ncbi:MAG: VIT1/CCC1 transporter family protein [Propionibacterium sp.]